MKKSNIIESLEWRYATKKFDQAKKVSDADLNEILEAGRLAPSSFGLQPWKFIVITNPELRKELKEVTWSQPQVCDASHLIVIAVRTDVNEAYIKNYIKKIAEVRKVPVENLKGYEEMMVGAIKGKSKDTINHIIDWSARQVYIALGFMLETAALKKIDACPMEGFDADKYDEILSLKKDNLHAVVLMPVGHRADDPAAKMPKVRFDQKDIVIRR